MGEMIPVFIVAIVMIAVVLKSRYSYLDKRDLQSPAKSDENARLRDEISQLKERLKVLERITVDKENSLANEIDSLRDR